MSDIERSDDEMSIDEEEFERQNAARASAQLAGGGRKTVAAEKYEVGDDWKPPFHKKTEEQWKQIEAAVSKSFMFSALEDDNLKEVIDAFLGPQELAVGTEVIKQGAKVTGTEPGLFVIQSGKLDVYKRQDGEEGNGTKVFTYDKMGQSFGELALLYDCPRTATVVVSTDAIVWSIDRETFNQCVKGAAMHQRERREKFLRSVEILSSLSQPDLAKITDVLQPVVFQKGAKIISKGEEGSCFFILEQGSATASVDGNKVKGYVVGDYFGELALLRKQARAVDVVADASPTKLLTLDGDSFKRLLGSLEGVLSERAKDYTSIEVKGVPAAVTDAFREWDKAGTGTITRRRIVKVFKTLSPGFPDDQLEALLASFGAPKEEAGRMDYMKLIKFVFATN
eukprot:TRINITY_DN5933_c0_g1_i1.p1 TRINITY_DN5933_c0_g1~~TRINITY_DN5933_c0_g1_i1.p1  ORF type:complete len:396 (+),score=112.20 TRINITY_DN5933_c0_g1_i1:68-1255(+)